MTEPLSSSPRSFLIYVVKIGDPPYCRYTEPFLRRYCRRYGYPLVFGSMAADSERHVAWQKLLAHRWAEAEFILILDLDIAPVENAPPIHPVLDLRRVNLARNHRSSPYRRATRLGIDPTPWRYNTGVIGLPRSWAPLFERIYRDADLAQETCMEQGHVNRAIADQQIPVHELNVRWNYSPGARYDPATIHKNAHFLHFKGSADRRLRNTRLLWEHYNSQQLL